jgi:glucose/arabinose dehydrogenase
MRHRPPRLPLLFLLAALVAVAPTGCTRGPVYVAEALRKPVDRAIVDYPGGTRLVEVVRSLTGACDFEEDADGNWIIAESGAGGYEPRIFGFHKDGTYFSIYPAGRSIRTPNVAPFNLVTTAFRIYGPIGGILLDNGRVYVTHRDADGNGAVTAFTYDGGHETIVGGLPARGDNGLSDIALNPTTGRLWFGVGAATNSGVVGLDNWTWVKKYPDFCDRSLVDLKLNGFHFKSKNPDAGIFGGPEIAVTAPFQPFNVSTQTRIRHSDTPTGAIYSADPKGGSLQVEAHGVRRPRGITFSRFANPYMTCGGMELRGTRPIKDDPDALLIIRPQTWYGFPDFSTDLEPITEPRYQPTGDMAKLLIKSGYDEISPLIDRKASNNGQGLIEPAQEALRQATFPSLAGADKFDFVPDVGPFAAMVANVIVPLSGDRAPFATSGRKLNEPVGFKVVRVDPTTREVSDFVRNTKNRPASMLPEGAGLIERPVAVKFARDGSLYIVDAGEIQYRPDGREKVKAHTGRILKLEALPAAAPTTQRSTATTESASSSSSR